MTDTGYPYIQITPGPQPVTLDPIIVTAPEPEIIDTFDPGSWEQPGHPDGVASPGIGGIETGIGNLSPTSPIYSSGSFSNGLDYRTWDGDNAPTPADLGLTQDEMNAFQKWANSNNLTKNPQMLGAAAGIYTGTGATSAMTKPLQNWFPDLLNDPQKLKAYLNHHNDFRKNFADAGTLGLYFQLDPAQQETFLKNVGIADDKKYDSIYDYLMHDPEKAGRAGFIAHDIGPDVISDDELAQARVDMGPDLVNQDQPSEIPHRFRGPEPMPEGGPLAMASNLTPQRQIWQDYTDFAADPEYNWKERLISGAINNGPLLGTLGAAKLGAMGLAQGLSGINDTLGAGNTMVGWGSKIANKLGAGSGPSSLGDIYARDAQATRRSIDAEAERLSNDPLIQLEFGAIPGRTMYNDVASVGVNNVLNQGPSLGMTDQAIRRNNSDTAMVSAAGVQGTPSDGTIKQVDDMIARYDARKSAALKGKAWSDYQKRFGAANPENRYGQNNDSPANTYSSVDYAISALPMMGGMNMDMSVPGYSGPSLTSPGIGGI